MAIGDLAGHKVPLQLAQSRYVSHGSCYVLSSPLLELLANIAYHTSLHAVVAATLAPLYVSCVRANSVRVLVLQVKLVNLRADASMLELGPECSEVLSQRFVPRGNNGSSGQARDSPSGSYSKTVPSLRNCCKHASGIHCSHCPGWAVLGLAGTEADLSLIENMSPRWKAICTRSTSPRMLKS